MTPGNPQRRLTLVEQIHEHLRARLAELEDQLTLGIAPSGVSAAAIRHVGSTTYTFLF